MRFRFSCLLVCACVAPAIHAEALYVIEQLVVTVSSVPGGSGERVATLRSGDRVELLEPQSGGEAHVRVANGAEGWVKAAYLSPELPLQQRLAERTAEVEKLKQDVSRLESDLAAARVAASMPAPTAEPAAASPAVRDAAFFMTPPADQPRRAVWPWALGWSAAALVVGVALGWRMLDRRIRRKYGGMRIY